jgi:spore germination protein KC
MNTLARLAIILVSLLFLGGCWDRTELNDLALITALAFDKAENNQIQVTAQIIKPRSPSGGGMGEGGGGEQKGGQTTIRSEKGLNITDALSKLQRIIPRKQFWGVCDIFIFSDKLAELGIREQVDFLLRHPGMRERAYLFVSSGKAADTLELFPPIENSSAVALRKLSDLQIGMRITIEQLSQMLKGDSQAVAVPLVYILKKNKSAEPFQTIPYIFGTAVFKKDKMIGSISEKSTRGLLWIKDEIKEYTITYKKDDKGHLVSLQPVKAKVKLIPQIRGEQWIMTIKVKTEGDIVENDTNLNLMNSDLLSELDKAFENDIRERIEYSLEEVQHRLKVDIVDFAKEFHRKYPKHWEQAKDHWDEMFPKVKVNIEIEAHALRPGLINMPGGIPQDEVKFK